MAAEIVPARSEVHRNASPPSMLADPSGRRAGSGATAGSGKALSGVYLPFERGMTLYGISRKYGVPVASLMKANGITDPTSIPAGARIFVPGATRRLSPERGQEPGRARFGWPLRGAITSPFGATTRRSHHTGIDIDGEEGDPIVAAAGGRVESVGHDPRYGLLVIVGHDDGYFTWYAHCSDVLVSEGDEVERGQEIALVGHSGDARGTHLHFEVRAGDRPVNPLPLLEGRRVTSSASSDR